MRGKKQQKLALTKKGTTRKHQKGADALTMTLQVQHLERHWYFKLIQIMNSTHADISIAKGIRTHKG